MSNQSVAQPTRTGRIWLLSLPSVLLLILGAPSSSLLNSQDAFEQAPIFYSKANPIDPVLELQKKIASKASKIKYQEDRGFLDPLLEALEISPESQMLVYSKTSLQLHRISPITPRAIYFNDDVYVGFIPGSDRLEISTADPRLGGVFYTVKQTPEKPPTFLRDQGNCLACHATGRTQGVPGHLVRSVYTSPSGQPHYGMGTYLTTQQSPFDERWGGWFVTGSHGSMRHLGNLLVAKHGDDVDRNPGANVASLEDRIRVSRYPSKSSDIIAMMVLAHQAEMHNLITLVNFQTRQAMYQGKVMNKALERPDEFVSDSTRSRIRSAVEKMVRYMLFHDETKLTAPITSKSGYQSYFEALGPKDKKGRSLREFDLQTRTFKHPCSYLIYSKSFQALPEVAKTQAFRRLWEILSGQDESDEYKHLTGPTRRNILEILIDTHKGLPDYWKLPSNGNKK